MLDTDQAVARLTAVLEVLGTIPDYVENVILFQNFSQSNKLDEKNQQKTQDYTRKSAKDNQR